MLVFSPSWTQRTVQIRLPSYSPYQKTHNVDIQFAFRRYFLRESMIIAEKWIFFSFSGLDLTMFPNFLGFILSVCHKADIDWPKPLRNLLLQFRWYHQWASMIWIIILPAGDYFMVAMLDLRHLGPSGPTKFVFHRLPRIRKHITTIRVSTIFCLENRW